MRTLSILLMVLSFLPTMGAEPLTPWGSVVFRAASAEEGARLLRTQDGFFLSLSPFDRASRSKDARRASPDAFADFVASQVQPWTPQDQEKLNSALAILKKRLTIKKALFPKTVILVKTSGLEEGGAAYCRGQNVICLPTQDLARSEEALSRTLCHELFHLVSRNSETLRRELYRVIGFRQSKPLILPEPLASMKITNPDAHSQDSVFDARLADGTSATVMPVLLANRPYDFSAKADFFEYLGLVFFSVTLDSGGVPRLKVEQGTYVRFTLGDLQNFYERVGRNTDYVIDPEEILAENFVLLFWGGSPIKSPGILEAMKAILEP